MPIIVALFLGSLKNDTVVVLTGKDAKKVGTVLSAMPKTNKIVINEEPKPNPEDSLTFLALISTLFASSFGRISV